jgi:hypothetical protein
MSKDIRPKAFVLFNFAGLNEKQMEIVVNQFKELRRQTNVYRDGKFFKKNKLAFNWFICTVEPSTDVDTVSINHYVKSEAKNRTVMFVKVR